MRAKRSQRLAKNKLDLMPKNTLCKRRDTPKRGGIPESSGRGPGAWLDAGPEALVMQTRTTSAASNGLGIGDFSSGGVTDFGLNGAPILAEIYEYASSAYSGGERCRFRGNDVPCGELPYPVLLSKTPRFGCQPLTCHHRHHRHADAG